MSAFTGWSNLVISRKKLKLVCCNTILCILICCCIMLAGCKKKPKQYGDTSSDFNSFQSDIINNSSEQQSEINKSDIVKKEATSSTTKSNSKVTSSFNSEKKEPFNNNTIINLVINDIKSLNTKLTYDTNVSNMDTFEINVQSDLSNKEIGNKVFNGILDNLGYENYLQFCENPHDAPPVLFDYNYNIKYKGLSDDKSQHIFILGYRLNYQHFKSDNFDTDTIVKNVINNVEKDNEISVTHSDKISGFSFSYMINIVKLFDTEQEATEELSKFIQNFIYSKNQNCLNNYNKFNIVYYTKTEDSFTFILYLA